MHERALFRRFPELAGRLPWLPLATLPTAVERLPVTARTDVWVKRDDRSATPYGGNKVRKLEFLLAAARAAGARRLITVGAAGSHHALATTIYGRQLGFAVTAILFPQPLTQHVRDILTRIWEHGADLRYTRRMELIPAMLFATTLRYRHEKTFVIPAGGSDATGTLGYVDAGLELAEQIKRAELPEPATVFVAAGTLGTAAGLAFGFEIAGLRTSVKAVRITSRLVTNERTIARLIRGTEIQLRRFGADVTAAENAIDRIELVHDHIGLGYGKATEPGEQATALFQKHDIHLDPTYTAKAAAAFLANVSSVSGPVLFWQTLSGEEPVAPNNISVQPMPAQFAEYLRGSIAE